MLNGYDARRGGDIDNFDVRYQSATHKTPSEVIHVPKSTTTTGTPVSSPFVRFDSAYSAAATVDLAAQVAEAEKAIRSKRSELANATRKPNNADRVATLEAEKAMLVASLPALRAQLVQAQQALLPERRAECLLHLNKGFSTLGGVCWPPGALRFGRAGKRPGSRAAGGTEWRERSMATLTCEQHRGA